MNSKIGFCCYVGTLGQNQVLKPIGMSELPSLIFTKLCLRYINNYIDKKSYRIRQVIRPVFKPWMSKVCEIELSWQIIYKYGIKSYQIGTVFAPSCIRYKLMRESNFIHKCVSIQIFLKCVKSSNSINVKITMAKNSKNCLLA